MLSHFIFSKPSRMNSEQTWHAYLRDYRQNFTRPRMEAAERALARRRIDDGQTDGTPLVTHAVIEQLRLVSENCSHVVPYIHDLWCEGMFRISSAGSYDPATFLNNRFLKPLADFSAEELGFEESLAAMDLRTLITVAGNLANVTGGSLPAAARCRDSSSDIDAHAAQRMLAIAATSDSFMNSVMKLIHENWVRACRQHYQAGKPIPYEYLNDFHMRKLRANARADILGILLFMEDGN
jgi:hypothetical protein